jgi:hypothetical protein
MNLFDYNVDMPDNVLQVVHDLTRWMRTHLVPATRVCLYSSAVRDAFLRDYPKYSYLKVRQWRPGFGLYLELGAARLGWVYVPGATPKLMARRKPSASLHEPGATG